MIDSLLLALALASPLRGDTVALSLAEAIARSGTANPSLASVRAEAAASRYAAWAGTSAFLPSLELNLTGIRTTDPVAVFGLKLRQEAFTAGDLSLDALNRPAAAGGFSTAATMTLPLFAPEGLFGYAGARRAAAAREAAADRMAGVTTFRVIEAYWSAQLAEERVGALAAALAAARAHVARAEALHAQGLVTGLDARIARLRAAEVQSQHIGATADAANALTTLAVLVDLPVDAAVRLTDSLSGEFTASCDDASTCPIDRRGDLSAAAHAADAATAATRAAWGQNLPTVALFGSVAYHARTGPWSDGSDDWTVGFQVSWNVLRGLAGVGAVRQARARAAAAEAQAEAARDQALLETTAARRSLAAAEARIRVAESAAAEAREALAQAEVRYSQGTAPVAELLDVQAAATAAFLTRLATRRDLFVARAAVDFAYGAFDR